MLFQWICILFLIILNLQYIESHSFRYLTNPTIKNYFLSFFPTNKQHKNKRIRHDNQHSSFNSIKQNNNKRIKKPQHHDVVNQELTGELISSFLTTTDLYNYIRTNRHNLKSSKQKEILLKRIKEGFELIDKINIPVEDNLYRPAELTGPAKQLKEFLDTLPCIPTVYVTHAYNNDKEKALSVMLQHDHGVIVDM